MKPVNYCFGYRHADVTVLIRSRITLGAAKLGLAVLLIGGPGGSESASPNTDFEKITAAQASLSFLASASGHVCHPEGCESKDFDIAGFGLSSDGADDNKLILQFSATDKSNVQGFYLDTLQVTSSLFSPDTVTISGWSFHATSDQASRVADALMAVKSFAGIYWRYSRILRELDFAIIARSYRSLPTKPIPIEDVHRYQMQATDAVQNKEFDAAAVLYSRAVKIAPWWPEGEFNLGLILGDLKQFHYAIVYMKRYLALVPDASNARQV